MGLSTENKMLSNEHLADVLSHLNYMRKCAYTEQVPADSARLRESIALIERALQSGTAASAPSSASMDLAQ